ncbi:hypothetical protein MMC11_003984 [Xylographa trunciseda]|nr:hypothetical protein [Xylographa trunciseda]
MAQLNEYGETGYEKLLQNDDGENISNTEPVRSWLRLALTILGKVIVLSLALWGFATICLQIFSILFPVKPLLCNCGSSIAEAKSRGCRFDALSTAWLPPECIDEKLSAEFDKAGTGPNGTWLYYTDHNKTGVYTLEEIAMLADKPTMEERSYWMTTHWHTAHCLYYWKKSARQRETGVSIEQNFDNNVHVNHCVFEYLKRRPMEDVSVKAFSGFGDPPEGFDNP